MFKNILIVDDSTTARMFIKRCLEMGGFEEAEFFEASNGVEALQHLNLKKIDLILTDLNMPKIDGEQMIDIVKVYDLQFKVIVASVCPLNEQKRRIPTANGYFDKSEGMDVLLGKIKEVINSVPHEKNINH